MNKNANIISCVVHPSRLAGRVDAPPSKSHSLRAILFASMARGRSEVRNILASPDAAQMIKACRMLGASIEEQGDRLVIDGVAGKPKVPDDVIDCGNSGQVLRFAACIAAMAKGATVVTGDHSVRSNRPVMPMLDGLNQLGARAFSSRGNGHAPIIIEGPISAGQATIDGQDSQPVSGLLMAMAMMEGESTLHVQNPGETPWVDLTLHWLKRLGFDCSHKNHLTYQVHGGHVADAFSYDVPGDFSSIAYPVVAAIVTGSAIIVGNVDMDDAQGDKAILPALESLGADIHYDKAGRCLHVSGHGPLAGGRLDINGYIDALPILAVLGTYCTSPLVLENCAIARAKESDRLSTSAMELRNLGAMVEEYEDHLIIHPSKLKGGIVHSHSDHRIAMAMAVAALGAAGPVTIHDIGCVSKSYPNFWNHLQTLGVTVGRGA